MVNTAVPFLRFSMAKNIYRLPLFLEAKNKLELIKKMTANNVKHMREFEYFNIQKDGRKWIAWFYTDLIAYDRDKNLGENK